MSGPGRRASARRPGRFSTHKPVAEDSRQPSNEGGSPAEVASQR